MKMLKRFIYMERYNASFKKAPKALSARARSRLHTGRVAVTGILCALSTVLLFFGTLTGVLDLTALAASSMISVLCVIEFGGAYPYLLWGVTSVCAFLFLPDKLVFLQYFLFAGIYPALKLRLERLPFRFSLPLKLVTFNLTLTALALLSTYVFALPVDVGLSVGASLYLLGNGLLLLFDLSLTSVTTYYILRLRRLLHADKL